MNSNQLYKRRNQESKFNQFLHNNGHKSKNKETLPGFCLFCPKHKINWELVNFKLQNWNNEYIYLRMLNST